MRELSPVAIVTGASRGLGELVARTLAGRGYGLVLNARQPGPLGVTAPHLADSRRRRGLGETPRREVVAHVPACDADHVAAKSELVDVLEEDDVHRLAGDVGQKSDLSRTLDRDRDLPLVSPTRARDPA